MGLINSISQYFSTRFKKLNYNQWVCIIVVFSFFVCNLGLNTILSISIPVLNAIYPISIVLILLGLSHDIWKNMRYVYPVTIAGTGCVSVIYAMDKAKVSLGVITEWCKKLPMYGIGFCWVSVAAVLLIGSVLLSTVFKKKG